MGVEGNKTFLEPFAKLFVNRTDSYAQQLDDGDYRRVDAVLSRQVLQSHLLGAITVASYQLDRNNLVKTLVFDIDPQHTANPQLTTRQIVNACLDKKRFNKHAVLVEASRGFSDLSSFHVWVLFIPKLEARVAKWLGQRIVQFAEINPRTIEIFPKQTEIANNGYGNAIKLPLGLHRLVKKRSCFLDHETFEPLPPEVVNKVWGCSFSEADLAKIEEYATKPNQVQVKLSKNRYRRIRKVRPCFLEALKNHHLPHEMRLAAATEHLAAGFTIDEICGLFKNQTDFNLKKTKYQVEHAAKQGYNPFKCDRVRELGFCIGEACPIFRRRKREFLRKVEAL